MKVKNDPPDKKSDIKNNKSINSEEEYLNIKNENQILQVKPIITDIQTFKSDVINFRDLCYCF